MGESRLLLVEMERRVFKKLWERDSVEEDSGRDGAC